MKMLFVHLSDLHISSKTKIEEYKIKKINSSLSQFKAIEEIFIILTGDIAYSGKIEEYNNASRFLEILSEEFRQSHGGNPKIKVYSVPGNHDNMYDLKNESREYIESLKYDDGKIFLQELEKQSNYFSHFNSSQIENGNRITNVVSFEKNEYNIQINLLNSSVYACKDDHKGLLYILPDEVKKIQKVHNLLSITVMHHPPSWFKPVQSTELERIIYNNTDILLVGHEHDSRYKDIKFENMCRVNVLDGGKISINVLVNQNCNTIG